MVLSNLNFRTSRTETGITLFDKTTYITRKNHNYSKNTIIPYTAFPPPT